MYKLIYDIVVLLPEKNHIQLLLQELMDDSNAMEAFYDIETYPLITVNVTDYCKKLEEIFLNDENRGEKIIHIQYTYWRKKYGTSFHERASNEAFIRSHTDGWFFLSCLFTHRLRTYYEHHNGLAVMLVTERRKNIIHDMEEALFQQHDRLQQKFMLQLTKQSEENIRLQKKYQDIGEEKKKLEQQLLEQEKQLTQTYRLSKENRQLENQFSIVQQNIIVVGIEWSEDVKRKISEQYKLKSLECLSAVEQLGKLDALHDKIVIFSSRIATHSAFNKLKANKKIRLFQVSEQNPQRVFEEILIREW